MMNSKVCKVSMLLASPIALWGCGNNDETPQTGGETPQTGGDGDITKLDHDPTHEKSVAAYVLKNQQNVFNAH